MSDTSPETLTELERQAEFRRAEFAQTVDELHNRTSPGAIKADVRNYARGRMQILEERMRENPLQAMAIATVIAYPLWRVIGRIPAPVLLMGAGVALSRRGHSDGYGAEAKRYDGSPGRRGVTEKLSDAASGIADKASDTLEDVRGMASEKVASLSGALSGGYQSGREAAAGAATQIEDTYNRARDNVIDLLDRYPMLTGVVAFAAGSLLASSLPVTSQEKRLLGNVSDDVRRRTQDLAAEGFDQAKVAARQIYDETASQVREQGLTPSVAANTVQNTVETAREAVERTKEAARSSELGDASYRAPRR
jgi:hypothetical protein